MNRLAQRRDDLAHSLLAWPDAHARLGHLVDEARRRDPLPAQDRTDANLVPGCMANLWVVAAFRDGRCRFRCDSDSLVVKSIATLLCDFYSDAEPREILALDPSFLQSAGITQHLSANRRNALSRVWDIIRAFASSHARSAFLCDAHNHLQDERFAGRQEELVAACRDAGIGRMVVNGSSEADWPAVAALAERHPDLVVPSYGCHPWYLAERTPGWLENLRARVQAGGAVGEIGLDRWKEGLPWNDQEEACALQLRLAAEFNRPASLHCLKAWGPLVELLEREPRPARGFLLHSFGGSAELIERLAPLGAYFSLPGYIAHERKARQRDIFLRVPPDRLLIETDAPDQLPPPPWITAPLADAEGRPLHHPANLPAVYAFAAELFGDSVEALAGRVAANFQRLFGPR